MRSTGKAAIDEYTQFMNGILEESLRVQRTAVQDNMGRLRQGADLLAACLSAGHKLLIFGNGGSAADAQHIAAEFINRFRIERPPLAALALTTDSSVLTSIGNDYQFDLIFDKQVRALGREGDVAWGISTSGNSRNVIEAVQTARRQGLTTIAMTGRGGRLAVSADLVFSVDSDVAARVQEAHRTLAHLLCELVERILFPEGVGR
jgi:D-sedoheptulose 7-phosphate isomerase